MILLSAPSANAWAVAVEHAVLWLSPVVAAVLLLCVRAVWLVRGRHQGPSAEADGELLSPDVLVPGCRAVVETLGPGGLRRADGRLSGVGADWVAVEVASADSVRAGAPVRVGTTDAAAGVRFYSVVKEHCGQGAFTVLYLARPEWVERVQRRYYPRAAVWAPVAIWQERAPADGPSLSRAIVEDLSVGGCRALVPVPLQEGGRARIRWHSGQLEGVEVDARIVACEQGAGSGEFRHVVRCEFVAVPLEVRRLLAGHCLGGPAASIGPSGAAPDAP